MYPTFLISGPPNAGKGTLGKELVEAYHLNEVGTGNICRREKDKQSQAWREAKAHMEVTKSTLWPTETLMRVVSEDFRRAQRRGAVLLDGFLRHVDQNEHLVKLVQNHQIPEIVVIDVQTPDKVCIERSIKRDREDDADIRLRLKDYHDHTVPAIHALMASANILPVQRIIFKGDQCDKDLDYRANFVRGIGLLFGLHARVAASVS